MIFLEKAKLEKEEKEIEFSEDGLPSMCPSDYGYEKNYSCSDVECEDCWNREMPNTDIETEESLNIIEAHKKAYEQGLNDAWECVRKINTLKYDVGIEIFGYEDASDILVELSPKEALAKLKAYEEAQKIEVGDVMRMMGNYCVVTSVDKDEEVFDVLWGSGIVNHIPFDSPASLKKTGKHLDISSILEQIGE